MITTLSMNIIVLERARGGAFYQALLLMGKRRWQDCRQMAAIGPSSLQPIDALQLKAVSRAVSHLSVKSGKPA